LTEGSTTPSPAPAARSAASRCRSWWSTSRPASRREPSSRSTPTPTASSLRTFPWAWVSIRRSSQPCERRTAARSWWRPQPLHRPRKAEDAPDRTSQLLGLGLLLATDEFLVPARAGRTDPPTSAHQRPMAPGNPRGHGTAERGPLSGGGVGGPPSRCRGASGRPWPPRRAGWASFFANDKRLEVLSGTNFIDLLKEHQAPRRHRAAGT
jgi:hypothetical protein